MKYGAVRKSCQEKPRLFYGMYLFIKIMIQRFLYLNKDDHQKKEKFMNINLPDILSRHPLMK